MPSDLADTRDEVWTVAFSPDGNTLASGSLTLCEAVDTHSGQERTLQGHKGCNQLPLARW